MQADANNAQHLSFFLLLLNVILGFDQQEELNPDETETDRLTTMCKF